MNENDKAYLQCQCDREQVENLYAMASASGRYIGDIVSNCIRDMVAAYLNADGKLEPIPGYYLYDKGKKKPCQVLNSGYFYGTESYNIVVDGAFELVPVEYVVFGDDVPKEKIEKLYNKRISEC